MEPITLHLLSQADSQFIQSETYPNFSFSVKGPVAIHIDYDAEIGKCVSIFENIPYDDHLVMFLKKYGSLTDDNTWALDFQHLQSVDAMRNVLSMLTQFLVSQMFQVLKFRPNFNLPHSQPTLDTELSTHLEEALYTPLENLDESPAVEGASLTAETPTVDGVKDDRITE